MKLTMEKRDLSSLTTLVYRAASTKNTIPVLAGLLIETDSDEGLVMTATDMEIGIKASSSSVEIIEPGSVLVNAHYFADFIKLLPDGPVTLELDNDRAKLNVNYGRSSGSINTYRDYEYPDLPLEKMQTKMTISQRTLKEALRKTSFATAVTHFRQVFTGVLFDIIDSNTLKVVASDTHRMACFSYTFDGAETEPFSFIIPTRSVNELLRILDDNDEVITIAFTENNVIFAKDNFMLLSRLIEGQYPNYDLVIPSSFNTSLTVNTEVLANTLERARTMPTDDKLKIQHVRFNINDKEILVNAYSEMMGEIEEVIEDIKLSGDNDVQIAFNTNYFLDVIKVFTGECEEIDMHLSGALSPTLIQNPKKDNYLYVLVPLRTTS
ncbi:MAG TPA: DNA polymerase III subunit beta [Gelria sp.]|jgi:DNA polymerase-3 subunit beta|nr:DNA polymerase III subunit beta [Gelria sp.]